MQRAASRRRSLRGFNICFGLVGNLISRSATVQNFGKLVNTCAHCGIIVSKTGSQQKNRTHDAHTFVILVWFRVPICFFPFHLLTGKDEYAPDGCKEWLNMGLTIVDSIDRLGCIACASSERTSSSSLTLKCFSDSFILKTA